jgi:hypothetical protein
MQEPEYYYRYSQSLKAVGNYAKADKMLEQFSKISHRPAWKTFSADYLNEIKENSGKYEILMQGSTPIQIR